MGLVGRSLDEIVAGAFPWSKAEEEERARVEAQREAEAAVNRDVAQQRRIDRLEAQLTEERRAHRRAQQQLDVGREGWSKARRRARERESVDDYQRSYGGVYYR
jgi:flagellar biosynthesis chaperone FliJ